MAILIVDDDQSICRILGKILQGEGYSIEQATQAADAWQVFSKKHIEMVLLDMKLPDRDGIELAQQMLQEKSEIPIVLISAYATIPKAVEATKIGVYDFLEKPFERDRILVTVKNALSWGSLKSELSRYKPKILNEYNMIGQSDSIKRVFEQIDRTASINSPVMILGENGVGKELVAQAIHDKSTRSGKKMVKINCPAIPETLMESELFGHTRGAFTGAHTARNGRLAAADGSTLLLDEIGDLSLLSQAKLLRFLDSGEIQKVGSTETATMDVRILAATNRNLQEMVSENRFRQDLYYRLDVLSIRIPPLRERIDDIPLLVEYFIDFYVEKHGVVKPSLSQAAMNRICRFPWPGNVRQLKHFVERMLIINNKDKIDLQDVLPLLVKNPDIGGEKDISFAMAKKMFEKEYIEKALSRVRGNISKAAEILKMDRANLHRKMKELGMK